jgi:hypothetical protein
MEARRLLGEFREEYNKAWTEVEAFIKEQEQLNKPQMPPPQQMDIEQLLQQEWQREWDALGGLGQQANDVWWNGLSREQQAHEWQNWRERTLMRLGLNQP